MSISNSQLISINGVNALGTAGSTCGATGQPYLEGPSLYRTDSWGTGVPGPYLLEFAAKPTSRPSACAANLGEPNTANEVIAYATAQSPTGPYTYKGILMCGSSSEWTDQATLMPLQLTDFWGNTHQAIAMYYHDGPGGNEVLDSKRLRHRTRELHRLHGNGVGRRPVLACQPQVRRLRGRL
jgi:hypothetical protein